MATAARAGRCGRSLLVGLCLWSGFGPAAALGAGLRDVADGWLLDARQAVALLQDPPGTPEGSAGTPVAGAWVQAGQLRLFGAPELPVLDLGGGASFRRGRWTWFLAGHWQRTGNGLVVEDQGRLRLGGGPGWTVAGRLDWGRLVLGGRREGAALTPALELAGPLVRRPHWSLDLTAVLAGGAPPAWFGRGGRQNRLRAVLTDRRRRLAVALAVDLRGDGTPCLGGDLLTALGPACGVGVRADPSTGSLGPVTVWRLKGLLVRTSHVVHPDLGPSHRFQLTAGRLEAVR